MTSPYRTTLHVGATARRGKLATNTDTYRKMTDDMDINCGNVPDAVSIDAKGEEIFAKILEVASGERSKSELLGYGNNEFVPWHIGAVM